MAASEVTFHHADVTHAIIKPSRVVAESTYHPHPCRRHAVSLPIGWPDHAQQLDACCHWPCWCYDYQGCKSRGHCCHGSSRHCRYSTGDYQAGIWH